MPLPYKQHQKHQRRIETRGIGSYSIRSSQGEENKKKITKKKTERGNGTGITRFAELNPLKAELKPTQIVLNVGQKKRKENADAIESCGSKKKRGSQRMYTGSIIHIYSNERRRAAQEVVILRQSFFRRRRVSIASAR